MSSYYFIYTAKIIIFVGCMKRIACILLIFMLTAFSAIAGDGVWNVEWNASARMSGATGRYMPFWARTGEDGILPVRSSGMLVAGADLSYSSQGGFFFETGTNLAGVLSLKSPLNANPVYGLVDRLYVSGGWRMLRMDIGLKPRHGDLGVLSVTGGDLIMSSNARNMPGVNLSSDWIYFEKGHWVGIKGNLAHYHMFDPRSVRNAMVHDKSVAVKFALGHRVDLIAGFHHYALWGGNSAVHGPQAESFRDYVKVFFARRGDASDSLSDQLNVFGNHLGNEWARLVWRADLFSMTFQYDKPFEDNSGMIFQNFPDGVWTLQFALNDRKAFVCDITYEFINTTWQSGDRHDRPATKEEMDRQDKDDPYYGKVILGGMDNYFNNSPYNSGWTHYGRAIGLPLLTPYAPDTSGICNGIMNNRVRAHHIGLGGMVARKVPYRFKSTFSENFGTYSKPLAGDPWQLSLALEADLQKDFSRMPVTFSVGIYGDIGHLYQDCAGLTLRISCGSEHRISR